MPRHPSTKTILAEYWWVVGGFLIINNMKETFYFSHDSNARSDEKILPLRAKYGAKGYGIYFMIIEMLREANAYQMLRQYSIISYELKEDENVIKDIIENFNLFEKSEKYFWSKSLKERMKKREDIVRKRRIAGKKGGLANVKQMLKQKTSKAQALKERKVKESKGKNNVRLFSKDSDEYKLAERLFKLIRENNPTYKQNIETEKQKFSLLQKWCEPIEKLLRIDKKTREDILIVIEWSQKDDFWKSNILSTEKLRKQFDKLTTKIISKNKKEKIQNFTIDGIEEL